MDGTDLVVRGPRRHHTLAVELLAHKAEIAAMLEGDRQPSVSDRPTSPCYACRSQSWWQRPPEHGSGWVCGRCHPDPRELYRLWLEPSGPPPELAGDRGRLLAIGAQLGWPLLPFKRAHAIVGIPEAWETFCRTAADADIGRALRAAEAARQARGTP